MADKEFGRVCQQCKNKGGDTFARMYYKPIGGKWLRLCGVCWEAVEQLRALDTLCCEEEGCKEPAVMSYCETHAP